MGMTNRDWLFSLPLEEQYAWMNAERTESPTSDTMRHIGQVIENTIKRGVYGDTESENEDSRDKLEAEVRKWCGKYAYQADMVWTWLNRQAAITEEQTRCKWVTASADEIAAWRSKAEKLKAQVDELTAERDNLKANNEQLHTLAGEQAATIDELTAERDNLKDDLIGERGKLNRKMNALREVSRDYRNERDHYRSKFDKCIDYADAIHALMDDEGLA